MLSRFCDAIAKDVGKELRSVKISFAPTLDRTEMNDGKGYNPYMLGGWVNPHREQQTIPQGQTSIPPKSFSTPTANGQIAP